VELGLQNAKLQSSNGCSAFAWKATIKNSTIVVEHKMTFYISYLNLNTYVAALPITKIKVKENVN
jgi:hypothetical protein